MTERRRKKRKPLWTEQFPEVKAMAGRVCTFPRCETKLSLYNESDRCKQHERTKIQPR